MVISLNCSTFQAEGPSLGASLFQGDLPFTKKSELSPGAPTSFSGIVTELVQLGGEFAGTAVCKK